MQPYFNIENYDYDLPAGLIAQFPAQHRSRSRLMVLDKGTLLDRSFADLPDFLDAGDLLVVNDTKVVPARLFARKPTGGRVELLVLKELEPHLVMAMFRTKRGLHPGLDLEVLDHEDQPSGTHLKVVRRFDDGTVAIGHPFEDWNGLLQAFGHVALPPYIRRTDREEDFLRYQTIYARKPGAVAAPTAGLHFDRAVLDRLNDRGVGLARVTLHVGPGTFKPIRVEDIRDHHVDPEWVDVSQETIDRIQATRQAGARVCAVGTTTVRALESTVTPEGMKPFSGPTNLYILPGHDFQAIDCMVTNFHLPKSSLMVLVSALAGRKNIINAYQEAIQKRYRFFSYGDAMLIFP